MACDASEQLTAYLDGELANEEKAKFESHLSGCAACQADLAMMRAVLPKLATAIPELEPSAQLRRNVLNAIPEKRGLMSWLRLPVFAPIGGLAAVATVAAIVVTRHNANTSSHEGGEIVLAENLDVVADLGALETADLSDEDLDVVANLDELEAKE